jgi:hypothetical protein
MPEDWWMGGLYSSSMIELEYYPSDERTFSSLLANAQDDSGGNRSLKVFTKVADITHKGSYLMVPLRIEDCHQYRSLEDEVSIRFFNFDILIFLFYVYGCFACHVHLSITHACSSRESQK